MATDLTRKVVFANGEWLEANPDLHVQWDIDPVFEFATEVQVLQTLEFLAEDYRATLEHARHYMRYIKAVIAQSQNLSPDERPKPQALIGHSRLARQTVYDALAAELRKALAENGEASC
jgi:hypothetical protein